ncbi:hypothetical protein J6A31_01960 [bacterium]|nr:hypothetical protein [bacterium]
MKFKVQEIDETHIIKDFDCGLDSVNHFLKTEALQNNKDLLSKTYVVTQDRQKNVIAYITICPHILSNNEINYVINRKYSYKAPAILIAQLGVDKNFKGYNIGKSLICMCFEEIVKVSKYLNFFAVIVDAANNDLIPYYEHQGFKSFRENKKRLYIKVKNIIDSYNLSRSILQQVKNLFNIK